jgi:molybdate transport system ATP-binding protein
VTKLNATIRARAGALEIDASFAARVGAPLVFAGRNGSGKTTILRCLAGLAPIDAGSIEWGGNVVDDPSRGIFVPPERRGVGYVFQELQLFPHLSAEANITFGLRARGAGAREAAAAARPWIELLRLAPLLSRKPASLSGGEAQRVALARALASMPQLLLLDEPLASLDAPAKAELRRDLRAVFADYAGVVILVTHDPVEALTLGKDICVLENGRIEQHGAAESVAREPKTRFVADFVGTNLFRGAARAGAIEVEGGGRIQAASGDGEVHVTIAPSAVSLFSMRPDGTPRNVWRQTVDGIDELGPRTRVALSGELCLCAEVTPAAARELGLAPGKQVWASVKATEVRVYPV